MINWSRLSLIFRVFAEFELLRECNVEGQIINICNASECKGREGTRLTESPDTHHHILRTGWIES